MVNLKRSSPFESSAAKIAALTAISGDKDLYHDLKAHFEIFVDRMKVLNSR